MSWTVQFNLHLDCQIKTLNWENFFLLFIILGNFWIYQINFNSSLPGYRYFRRLENVHASLPKLQRLINNKMPIEDYHSHTAKYLLLTCCTPQWELLINDLLFCYCMQNNPGKLGLFCYRRTIHSLSIIWMTHMRKKREAFYFSYLLECWIYKIFLKPWNFKHLLKIESYIFSICSLNN